jgi:hypothetical protein
MYRKPLAANAPEHLIQDSSSTTQLPLAWSMSGILYFESKERSGSWLYVLPSTPGSAPIPIVSPVILSRAAISPSGRWLAFCS